MFIANSTKENIFRLLNAFNGKKVEIEHTWQGEDGYTEADFADGVLNGFNVTFDFDIGFSFEANLTLDNGKVYQIPLSNYYNDNIYYMDEIGFSSNECEICEYYFRINADKEENQKILEQIFGLVRKDGLFTGLLNYGGIQIILNNTEYGKANNMVDFCERVYRSGDAFCIKSVEYDSRAKLFFVSFTDEIGKETLLNELKKRAFFNVDAIAKQNFSDYEFLYNGRQY